MFGKIEVLLNYDLHLILEREIDWCWTIEHFFNNFSQAHETSKVSKDFLRNSNTNQLVVPEVAYRITSNNSPPPNNSSPPF